MRVLRTFPSRTAPAFLLGPALFSWPHNGTAAPAGGTAGDAATRVAAGDARMGDGLRLLWPDAAGAPVCADGERRHGIDVSKWQGSIDWQAVAADGIDFAFVRVSDGTNTLDEYFDINWQEAKQNGIRVGAYQFFRPNQDPVAQAQLLLDEMGPLQPGDLPPVIDVEVTGGLDGAAVAAAVQSWLDVVEAATGRKPLVYTSPGFWDGSVGSAAFGAYPLWVAHWGVSCPTLPMGWDDWVFHQSSESADIGGISPVDEDWFNGTLADLDAFAVGMPVCGDGMCSVGETPDDCPRDCPPCGVIPPEGVVYDEGHACYETYGPAEFWRTEPAGYGGSLLWTAATDFAQPSNYAVVRLHFAQAGDYRLSAYVEPGYAQSTMTIYRIRAGGQVQTVPIDQSAAAGWTELGTFSFDAGGDQWVRLDDNTGEPNDATIPIVFDAFELVPDGAGGTSGTGGSTAGDDGSTAGGGIGTTTGDDGGDATIPGLPPDYGDEGGGCGCRTHGPSVPPVPVWFVVSAGLRRRRDQVPNRVSRASRKGRLTL